jgi:hypothetical protein
MSTMPRKVPTPAEINAQQRRDAEAAYRRKTVPAAPGTAVALSPKQPVPTAPGNRTPVQQYLDDISPASLVGRQIKGTKEAVFVTADDGKPVADTDDYVALCDQTLIGWGRFYGQGERPVFHMGPLYDGFVMPPRETLGDTDPTQWEIGLDGKPADPQQHFIYLVLQRVSTGEMFTYTTSSVTGRRAVGNLLRHYDRMQRTHPDAYPVVRLKAGGFNHRDERVGWVQVPVFAVVGRTPKDGAAMADIAPASPTNDMDDQIPFE